MGFSATYLIRALKFIGHAFEYLLPEAFVINMGLAIIIRRNWQFSTDYYNKTYIKVLMYEDIHTNNMQATLIIIEQIIKFTVPFHIGDNLQNKNKKTAHSIQFSTRKFLSTLLATSGVVAHFRLSICLVKKQQLMIQIKYSLEKYQQPKFW